MNKHVQTLLILFPLIVVLSFSSLYLEYTKSVVKPKTTVENTQVSPINISREVALLVKTKDFVSLSDFVDEELGLFFSPYYSFSESQGRRFTKEEVRTFFIDTKKNLWGYQDGSGQEILLTNNEYFNQYIYSSDFISTGKESLNHSLANGNTPSLDEVINNVYKSQILNGNEIFYIEYYISGFDPKYEGMDWQSLALIFVNKGNNQWKIVGIMHSQWTI
jgi:hypothetical protein